jgi:hypothetical protein
MTDVDISVCVQLTGHITEEEVVQARAMINENDPKIRKWMPMTRSLLFLCVFVPWFPCHSHW